MRFGQYLRPLVAIVALVGPPAQAERLFIDEAEPMTPKSVAPGKAWEEEDLRLPPWPQERDLIEIKVDDPSARFRHFIDQRSLKTGRDGVVRFTLVSESSSGARNVSYEGIRCTPAGRYKTFAYGNNGRFEPTTAADQWQVIDKLGSQALHYDLWMHYLCIPRKLVARPRDQQLRLLRSGRVSMHDNAGFITN
jgi:hypothetical protein